MGRWRLNNNNKFPVQYDRLRFVGALAAWWAEMSRSFCQPAHSAQGGSQTANGSSKPGKTVLHCACFQ